MNQLALKVGEPGDWIILVFPIGLFIFGSVWLWLMKRGANRSRGGIDELKK